MSYPRQVTVTEVGPRDGLQIERAFVPTATKIRLINDLVAAGVMSIEATSFVSPRAVPQLRDAAEVIAGIDRSTGMKVLALVPNPKGAELAAKAGVDGIVIVVSASESHNQSNLNRSVADSLAGFREIVDIARGAGVDVNGAIATSFGCPFEGDVPLASVFRIADRFAELGIQLIGVCDTTGMATPTLVTDVCAAMQARYPYKTLNLHFHNTRGLGLANVLAGLHAGVDHYDSSLGGLGGCPFAPGATGNICTEDLVHMLDEMGIATGIDLGRLVEAARSLERTVGRELPGQVMKAGPRLTLHACDAVARAVG